MVGLELGSQATIVAFVRDSTGGAILTLPVTFRSSAPAVATAVPTSNTTALVTGLSQGADTIYESVAGRGYWTLVTVFPARVPPCLTNPPTVGCGMSRGQWLLLGVDSINRTYGPWFITDSLRLKRKVVRVVVTDTTP